MSERRRSAIVGMLFSYLGLMISLARNVFLVPLYLKYIPLAEYGAWLATGGALALILINDFGLSGVVTQKMSARYGAGDIPALGGLAGSALAIGTLLSLLLAAVSLMLLPVLPGLGSLTSVEQHTVLKCFVIAVSANGIGVIGATAVSALRSLQRVTLLGSITLAGELSNVVVIVLGLLRGYGLYAIAVGLLARSMIITAGGVGALFTVCAGPLHSPIRMEYAVARQLLGQAAQFFLSSIAMKLQAQSAVFFVGSILGPATAAIYSLTVRALETVSMVISLINGALVPSVTHLFGSGNLARFRVVLSRLLILIAALTAWAMTVTVVLNPAFIRLWVGPLWSGPWASDGYTVSWLMAGSLFVSSVGYLAYDALVAQGKFRLVSRVFVLSSIGQVPLLMLLLRFGPWAAPFVNLVTAGAWGFVFWRMVIVEVSFPLDEARELMLEIAQLLVLSVAFAAVFHRLVPIAGSWSSLTVEGLLCSVGLAGAYLLASRRLRAVASEELGATLRVFRLG